MYYFTNPKISLISCQAFRISGVPLYYVGDTVDLSASSFDCGAPEEGGNRQITGWNHIHMTML